MKTEKTLGNKYIDSPTTIGEHLRNRRLELRLLQREVATRLDVTEECISYWEIEEHIPDVIMMPRIIQFLGYCPIPIDTSALGGKIYEYRLYNGLSYAALGRLLDVDATTVAGWEKNEHQPSGESLGKLKMLLNKNKYGLFSKK